MLCPPVSSTSQNWQDNLNLASKIKHENFSSENESGAKIEAGSKGSNIPLTVLKYFVQIFFISSKKNKLTENFRFWTEMNWDRLILGERRFEKLL